MTKIYDRTAEAIRITSRLDDFDGDVAKWKDAFYELWRYQMTWSFAYKIEVIESGGSYFDRKVFVELVVKEAYKTNALDLMETLGYRNVKTEDIKVGIVNEYKHDLDDIYELILDF